MTLILGFTEDAEVRKEDAAADAVAPNAGVVSLRSPLNGTAVALSSVSDPTFAEGILGQGAAVIPSDGHLVSPVNGTVVTMFGTGHAVTIRSDEGLDILLHVGIDTVNLKGAGFTALVASGDSVEVGQPLIDFDLAAISADYDPVTVMIVTNTDDFASVDAVTAGATRRGDDLLNVAVSTTQEVAS